MSNPLKGKRLKNVRNIVKHSDNLDVLFAKFYEIKKAEGRAEKTLKQYEDNYGFFVDFLNARKHRKELSAINKDVIRDYINYMREEIVKFERNPYVTDDRKTVGLSATTVNTRLKTLRVMFKCLSEEGIISDNPMVGVKDVSEPEEEIVVLTEDELRRLLSAPNQRNYSHFRDYVLMVYLLDGMARISEALALTVNTFDFETRTVTIPAKIAKNRKSRIIPIQEQTARLIRELIAENKVDFDSDYVFLSNYGEPITASHFRKRLYEYAKMAGIKKQVHPHLFRHTAATMALENGMDIRHLQKLLGHSDMRMVQRYTHLSNKSLMDQHGKYSALNNVMNKLNKPRKIYREL